MKTPRPCPSNRKWTNKIEFDVAIACVSLLNDTVRFYSITETTRTKQETITTQQGCHHWHKAPSTLTRPNVAASQPTRHVRRVDPDRRECHTHWPQLQIRENMDADATTGSKHGGQTRSTNVHFGTTTPHVACYTTDPTNAPEDHQRYMNPGHDRPSWCEKWSGHRTGSKSDPSHQVGGLPPASPSKHIVPPKTRPRQTHTLEHTPQTHPNARVPARGRHR